MVPQRAPGQPDGVGGGAQVAADQGEVAGLDGHVGAGAHGEAEVGLGEGGGVVDAVADHGDDPALGLEPPDDVDLVGRQHLGDRPRRCRPRRRPRRATAALSPVSRTGVQAEGAQLGDRLGRLVGLTVSATTSTPRTRPSQPTATGGPAGGLGRRRGVGAARPAAVPARRAAVGGRRRTAWPVDDAAGRRARRGCAKSLDRRAGRRRSRAAAAIGPGDRVLARRPRGRRPAAARSSAVVAVAGDDVDQGHPAGGDGAGLVEHDGVDPAGGLQHLGALDQDAELGAAAGADQQRGRRGQARARTGRR